MLNVCMCINVHDSTKRACFNHLYTKERGRANTHTHTCIHTGYADDGLDAIICVNINMYVYIYIYIHSQAKITALFQRRSSFKSQSSIHTALYLTKMIFIMFYNKITHQIEPRNHAIAARLFAHAEKHLYQQASPKIKRVSQAQKKEACFSCTWCKVWTAPNSFTIFVKGKLRLAAKGKRKEKACVVLAVDLLNKLKRRHFIWVSRRVLGTVVLRYASVRCDHVSCEQSKCARTEPGLFLRS